MHENRLSSSSNSSQGSDGSLDISLEDEDIYNPNQKKPRFFMPRVSITGIKSQICFLFIFVAISYYTIKNSSKLFSNSSPNECVILKWEYPSCNKYMDKITPPQTPSQWIEFRRKFEAAVGESNSNLDRDWADYMDDSHREVKTGFRVAVDVRISPGKGRGVFLEEPVRKGQVLWENRYSARFPDECSVRIFFASLSEEDQCNAIMWGYVNDFFGRGLQFQLDLDPAVYLNAGSPPAQANTVNRFLLKHEDELFDKMNLNDVQRTLESRQRNSLLSSEPRFGMVALHDMEAGTELLIDYAEIHVYGIKKLGWYESLCFHSRGFWGWINMV